MAQIGLLIEARDPLGPEALFLLHEAALEARRLYPDLIDPAAPMPTNRFGQATSISLLSQTEIQWVVEL
jgi:hypothetical protein